MDVDATDKNVVELKLDGFNTISNEPINDSDKNETEKDSEKRQVIIKLIHDIKIV